VIIGLLQKFRVNLFKDKLPVKLRTKEATLRTSKKDSSPKGWLAMIFLTSVGVSTALLGVRELKWLQPWELNVYDQMMRSRPKEAPDKRILLVTITEEDIQRQKWPLSDNTINQVLEKLESYQPRVIGLNIFRDFPQEPGNQDLNHRLQHQDNIIALCGFSDMGKPETPPPPNVNIDRVGFSDVISDESDRFIRRALLFAKSGDKKCTTEYSFASRVALNYLAQEKQPIQPQFSSKTDFRLGKAVFHALTENSGSYENLDALGYQILLNYRDPGSLAEKVTLQQVLNGEINSNLVKDRLVIIGTVAGTIDPGFYTPYSASPQQPVRMPSVLIHAQIGSEIISAALDGRPLIWYFSNWAEGMWVWSWSLVGGILAWRLRYPLRLGLAGGVSLGGLVGISYVMFLQAAWVPVIPPALALAITGVSVMAYTAYQTQQKTKVIILQVEKQQEAIAQLNSLLKETTAIYDKHVHQSPQIPAAPEKATGDFLLGGRYQIVKVLGSGGFGCTYVAKDMQRPGNPTCVVKQLMPARRDTKFLQVARRLFNTEAEILEVLGQHHQIPELLAYFEENQEFYLVQEYIQGHTLNEELSPMRGVQNEAFALDLLKDILEVLAFVHEHRVIHRDIKPHNIIRSVKDNRLVLIDFGAVKQMQPPTAEQTELATVAIGTRGYAPPEQFAGHPRLCSDIYALGMIGIQAVTGIAPHDLQPDPETGNVMWRRWAQVSEELAAILDKMVCYHFSDRYQSAIAALQDVKHLAEKVKNQ
jgi:CHASE2 domain-containing sensor protein/predicted Ser/Thr protein kinase